MPISMGICDSCQEERVLGSKLVFDECEFEIGTIVYVCESCAEDLPLEDF